MPYCGSLNVMHFICLILLSTRLKFARFIPVKQVLLIQILENFCFCIQKAIIARPKILIIYIPINFSFILCQFTSNIHVKSSQ